MSTSTTNQDRILRLLCWGGLTGVSSLLWSDPNEAQRWWMEYVRGNADLIPKFHMGPYEQLAAHFLPATVIGVFWAFVLFVAPKFLPDVPPPSHPEPASIKPDEHT